jgi:urease accessory protein
MPESWLPRLLQLQDSSFPTGGYAHSFGLEELTQLGLVHNEPTLLAYLRGSTLPALIHLELPFVAAAHAAAGNLDTLIYLDAAYAALRSARESRAASAQIGTRRLATWLKVNSADPLLTALSQAIAQGRLEGHHAIVFPAILRAAPVEVVCAAYAHQTLAGLCTASLKLIRIGQEGTQRVLAQALAELHPSLETAIATPIQEAGFFDPLTELASYRHETSFSRLFIS